jgi:hypothetical protein
MRLPADHGGCCRVDAQIAEFPVLREDEVDRVFDDCGLPHFHLVAHCRQIYSPIISGDFGPD